MKAFFPLWLRCFVLSDVLLSGVADDDDNLVDIINAMNTSWRAGENGIEMTTIRLADIYDITLPYGPTTILRKNPPVTFDARKNWPKCERVINRIRDQGSCNGCWAVATASVVSDRLCIETNGSTTVPISAEDILTCCPNCRKQPHTCIPGGSIPRAFEFWMNEGVVTGAEYRSTEGCKPFSLDSYRKRNVRCQRSCTNRRYKKPYQDDKYKGRFVYRVHSSEEAIQDEIMTHGPVVATVRSYDDLQKYKKGIYRHVAGHERGYHAVRMLGWGVENGHKYWLIANSYGTKYGEKGLVKFLRGVNHCIIESFIVAGRMTNKFTPRAQLMKGHTSGNAVRPLLRTLVLMELIFFSLNLLV